MNRITKSIIEDEILFKEFCYNRELSNSSIKNYKYALRRYSNFTNKTLEELIEEAENQEELKIVLSML